MSVEAKRILILGGGFAGVITAIHLDRIFARAENVEITLVSDENFLLFTPMLPEVATGAIEPRHIVSPIRACFRNVRFQNGEVRSIDIEKRVAIVSHCPMCRLYELKFDHLVLTMGSTTDFYGLPGVAEYAMPMKTMNDAMRLRNQVIDLFEHADMERDVTARKTMLTFVVAGGGFAGAETVAGIRDFAHEARRYYPRVIPEEVRVVLVHSGPRIMPEINERLASYALEKLRERGVEIMLNTKIRSAAPDYVVLSNGDQIPTKTLIWTAGVTPSRLLRTLPCPCNKRGQIVVDEYLEVRDRPGVWAIGDCAEIRDPETGALYPPTAQHAIRQAKAVAQNIAASIRAGAKRPFSYRPIGVLASLGRRSAVAEIGGMRFSGFFAWWLWRTVYLSKLPGLERKVRVAIDWTLDLFFPRDIVLLKTFVKPAPSETSTDLGTTEISSRRA